MSHASEAGEAAEKLVFSPFDDRLARRSGYVDGDIAEEEIARSVVRRISGRKTIVLKMPSAKSTIQSCAYEM